MSPNPRNGATSTNEAQDGRLRSIGVAPWVLVCTPLVLVAIVIGLISPFRNICTAVRSSEKQLLSAASSVLESASTGDVYKVIEKGRLLPQETEVKHLQHIRRVVAVMRDVMKVSLWIAGILSLFAFWFCLTRRHVHGPIYRVFFLIALLTLLISCSFNIAYCRDWYRWRRTRVCGSCLRARYNGALQIKELTRPNSLYNPLEQLRQGLRQEECVYRVVAAEFTERQMNSQTILAMDAQPVHGSYPFEFRKGYNVLFGDGHVEFILEQDMKSPQNQ
jgi:prepilin-type processing-associated H-X9-DG protein